MIELPYLSIHHELLRLHQKALEVVDNTIPITLLVLIYLSVLVVLLGGR